MILYMARHPERFAAAPGIPMWVPTVAGALFALAGVTLWLEGTSHATAVGAFGGPLIVFGLATIASWVAFGPGERHCTATISFPFWFSRRPAGDLECRVAFGFGAIMSWAICLVFVAGSFIMAFGQRPSLNAFQSATQWLLIIVLSPLLMLAALLMLVSHGGIAARQLVTKIIRRRADGAPG